jgi:glycine/D-amino acid oxidase-like deaminating enzyme
MQNGDAIDAPSFWLASLDEPLVPRPALAGDEQVDVAIVGAGFTGLWTAYYLAQQAPELTIAVVESQVAGFGASGRNGGWCNAHLEGVAAWAAGPMQAQAVALQRAMFDTVDEVGRAAKADGIDCDYAKSGCLNVTTNDAEYARGRALVAELQRPGFTDADFRWLDAHECDERVRMAGARGGVYSPHCAAIQPAKLARGLARTIERLGVTLYERSPAIELRSGRVLTEGGRLSARVVLRCTEGYSRSLRGEARTLLPMHTLMVVTEPLSAALWQEIGAHDRVLFGDARRLLSYAQRTADDRLAFGAGGRYFYGSTICDYFPQSGPVYAHVEAALYEYFPQLRSVAIACRWGGAFGVSRDWKPFVRFDRSTRLGTAGGYIGSGVAASNLAARTLVDLVLERETERTSHPWVQHRPPAWEPEPLRWLGVTTVMRIAGAADRADRAGRPSRLRSAIFDAFSGH